MNRHPATLARRSLPAGLLASALCVLFLLALLPAQSARAQSRYATTIRDGRAAANALLEQTGAPSVSLALVSSGRVVWREGFGYADVASKARPTATTMYGIGSVSKMIATAAVMQLVDDGSVSLDEPLVTYVPSFRLESPGYRSITVRMLLDHSSGLPGSMYASAFTPEYWPGYLDLLMATLAQSRLKHTPGVLSVYCNDGFTLVEELVPAVTGKTYPQYVQDEIFTPLGMTHSAYPLQAFADGSYAKAYNEDGSARPREVLNLPATGALYSTPADMARFAIMLMNGGRYGGSRVVSAHSIAIMGTDQTRGQFQPVQFNGARYGLGWDSVTQPGLKKVGFTAWMKGGDSSDYHAGLVVVPDERLAAVVTGVAPIDSGKAEALCERILLHALVDRGKLRRMPARIPAVAPRATTASPMQLAAINGYWAGNGLVLRVRPTAQGSQSLAVDTLGQGGWTTFVKSLRMRTDGRFHHTGSAGSLWTTSAGGRRYLVNRMVGGYGHYLDNMPLAQKLTAREPLSAAWQGRVGSAWLAVNEHRDALFAVDGGPLAQIGDVPEQQGYLTVLTPSYGMQIVDPSESDDVALMFLQIPGFGSRDLNDAVIEKRGGEDRMWFGSTFYRPLDGVPALASGDNGVMIGPEGYAEWRTVATAAALTVSAGTEWRLYDAELAVIDSGTSFPASLSAPAGAYLCVFAPAGAGSTVTTTPVEAGAAAADAEPTVPTPQPSLLAPLR